DPDGDALTYSLSVAPVGMTIDPATGLIDWTPKANEIGDQAVTVVVTDSTLATGTQPFVVHVIDATPPFVRLTVPASVQAGGAVTATAEANDNVGVASVTIDVNSANPTTLQAPPFQKIIAIPSSALPGATFADASASLTVTDTPDTTPPTVDLTSPPSVPERGALALLSNASDNVGVEHVAFFVNGVQVDVITAAPFQTSYRLPPSIAASDRLHV